jgi:simple sugar transport system substrate-binding protein
MRKAFEVFSLVMILTLVLAAPVPAATPPAEKQLHFVVLIHFDPSNPLAAMYEFGLKKAAERYGATYQVSYSLNDVKTQIDQLNTAILQKPDGIITTIVNNDAFDEPVARAIQQGIPVVAFGQDDNEGVAGNARLAYIGQDQTRAGYLVTKAFMQTWPKDTKQVGCFVEIPQETYAKVRITGIRQALSEAGITCELVETGFESQAAVAGRISAYLQGHPEVKVVIPMGTYVHSAAVQAVEAVGGKPGEDYLIGGYECMPDVLENIIAGKDWGCIDQQAWLQGYYALEELALYHLIPGFSPVDIDTSSGRGAIFTKDKAPLLLNTLKEMGLVK